MAEDLLVSRGYLFLLIFARISGVLMLLPLFGEGRAPRKVRFAFSVCLAILVFSTLFAVPITVPDQLLIAGGRVGIEFLTGLAVGAGCAVFFSCLAMLGDIISRLGGFSAAASFDPAFGESVPALVPFLSILGIAVFLLTGGMDALIGGLLQSFQSVPAGQVPDFAAVSEALVAIITEASRLVLRMAFPFILSSLTCWLIAGLLGRAALSAGAMPLGFSANTLLTLAVFHLALAGICFLFRDNLQSAFRVLDLLNQSVVTGG